jgi:PII-like signaling protein
VDGTAHGRRERAAFFSRNAEVPMMVIAVGAGDRIRGILSELGPLLQRPLLTLERVRICKRDGRLLATPAALPGADDHGMALWHKLMVYTSEAVQVHGEPMHRAIVRRLRAAGLSGATTQRGIWGFHGDHAPHGDRLLQLGRHVPAVTIVIDTPDRISAAFAVIDELTSERGLVTSGPAPAAASAAEPASPAAIFGRTADDRQASISAMTSPGVVLPGALRSRAAWLASRCSTSFTGAGTPCFRPSSTISPLR